VSEKRSYLDNSDRSNINLTGFIFLWHDNINYEYYTTSLDFNNNGNYGNIITNKNGYHLYSRYNNRCYYRKLVG